MEQEIRFRVTTEFKKVLERQANELNLSLSAYVRYILSKDLKNKSIIYYKESKKNK